MLFRSARIISMEIELQCIMDTQIDLVFNRNLFHFENSQTILPSQDRQLDSQMKIQFENQSMADSTSWFETKLHVWINWIDAFEIRRFEKWEAIGTNLVGTLEQHGAFNLLWEESSPEHV